MLTEYKPVILLIITVMAILCACGSGRKDSFGTHVLTVSLEPQRYLLERIAGPQWTVKTVLAKGEDPESFDPSMSDLKAIHDSRAYFKTGTLAFEDRLENHTLTGLKVYDTSKGIKRLEGTHEADIHETGESHHHHHGDGEYDPHIWTSIKNAEIMAYNMLTAMIELDPADSAVYRENYRSLIASLDSCDREIGRRLAPLKGSAFMVWHPSLSYFARDYELRQLSMGADNKEMSARDFRRRIDRARSEGAVVFFVQPDFDAGRSVSIAAAAGARNATANTLAYDLPQELLSISKIISQQR